ncbi:MAG: hypothetical protein LZF62_430044 [Nitrospira sp.]|nr:MAG: hypothetical protein LZF62_430044 [Nitrospira sp.]
MQLFLTIRPSDPSFIPGISSVVT